MIFLIISINLPSCATDGAQVIMSFLFKGTHTHTHTQADLKLCPGVSESKLYALPISILKSEIECKEVMIRGNLSIQS